MDIVERLKEQAVGREEWRIANPDDGSYVISFSWGDTLSPERDAREWLAYHLTRNPARRVAGEVRKVMAQSDTDMLMIDAANEIARLRDENAKLRADAERYRWLRDHAEAADWEMIGYQDTDKTDAAIDAAMQKGE